MNKEILVLKAPKNRGKTKTIYKLAAKFKDYYGNQIETVDKEYQNDIPSLFKIKNNIIGFFSLGDTEKETTKAIEFFKENNCNICITACRTKGETKKKILEFAKKEKYNLFFFDEFHCYIENRPEKREDIFTFANEERAKMMLDRLKYLI